MSGASQSVTPEGDFMISRVFDAPRSLVFKAWVEPEHVAARWFGPRGFTNPVCELDPRPGGNFYVMMRGPLGVEYPNKGVFGEVVPPERIIMIFDHSEMSEEWHDMMDPGRDRSKGRPKLEAVTTITFSEHGEKTTVTVRTRFESAAIRDAFLKIGMNEGWSQTLDRLAELLAAAAR